MSWMIADDPDEWETVSVGGTYGKYPGTDVNFGWGGIEKRRRSPEETARLKAERRQKEEDAILVQADAIRARRAQERPHD